MPRKDTIEVWMRSLPFPDDTGENTVLTGER